MSRHASPKRFGQPQGMAGSVHYLVAEHNKLTAQWLQADFDRFKLLRRIARAEEAGRRPSQASKTALAGLVIKMRDLEDKLGLIAAAHQALVDPDGSKQDALREEALERRARAQGLGPPLRQRGDWRF